MMTVRHLSSEELEQGLDIVRKSPKNEGLLELIVRRPQINEREVLSEGTIDLVGGLSGDNWKPRGCVRTPDGSAHPEMQITIMNSRVIGLLAQVKEHWPLAGDQLYVDMDLSIENLPAGTRVLLGETILEITSEPHPGCKKFTERFGLEANRFVNSPIGKSLRLRGLNAKVIQPGVIRTGDVLRKQTLSET